MAMQFKCTVGDERASFGSRYEALDAGWVLIAAESKEKNKYHCLCPDHTSMDWVRKALMLEPKKGGK
jgi:hypothetical protein